MTQHQHHPGSNLPSLSQLTTQSSEPWLSSLLAGMGEANGRPILMAGCSITEVDRRRLEATAEGIRHRLTPQPGERPAMAVILAKLLAAFPAQSQSDAPAAQRIEAYFEALSDVSMIILDTARKEIITGKAPECSGTWAPTPPQVATVCRRLVADERRTLEKIDRLLAAEPIAEISRDERKRVAAGLDRLKFDLKAMA